MTLSCNPELQTQLDATGTKLAWSNTVISALGDPRRLRCWHDSTINAVNPVATGIEFLNVGLAGAMVATGGEITGFGVASDTTIQQAVDLLTGSAVLRIEGNGNWVQGTLGLNRAAQLAAGVFEEDVKVFDFMLSGNPTAASGIGFSRSAAKVRPPLLIPSGTGPAAPLISATTPTIIELEDWTDPANPAVVGTATFTTRELNWVFDDPTMAAEIGDVALYTLDDSIKWTTPAPNERFELGGLLMIAADYNTEGGTQQLEQMLLSFKPYGRWPNYPFMDGQERFTYLDDVCTNPTTGDYTMPPPFKIHLYTATGYKNGAADRTPLYTHEIKAFNDKASGPINGPEWSQTPTVTEPCVPHFNCAQSLPWENMRTRRSSKAELYVQGFTPFSLSGTANDTASCNPNFPLFNKGGQQNSINHFYAMPAYPLKNSKSNVYSGGYDQAYMDQYWPTTPADPKLFSAKGVSWPGWQYSGYKWQPGSTSGHDWMTGMGGMRYDRYPLPTVLAHWASDPNYVRPQGAVPIRDIVEGWGLAYFNHSNHWMTDAKTFGYLPKEYATHGHAVFASAYYGGGPYGDLGEPMGPDKTIDLSASNYDNDSNYDPKGRYLFGSWKRDGLHAHCNAGLYAMLLNSPMHALAQMHDYHTIWMSNLGNADPYINVVPNMATLGEHLFQYRTLAWRWLSYVITWTCGTSHPRGFSQVEVENRFQIELECVYDQVYKPAFIDNDNSVYFTAIRNLGVAVKADGTESLSSNGGTLGLYMVHTMVMMRQTGLWARMRAKNEKCKKALDMLIRNYDKMIIDYCVESKMRGAYYTLVVPNKGTNATAADIPVSWAAYDAMLDELRPTLDPAEPEVSGTAPERYIDFVTRYTGRAVEVTGHPYFYYQYMCARRDYFPENPPANLDAAITKMEGWFAKYDQLVADGNGYSRKMLHPPQGRLLPPTTLGPNGPN